MVKSTQQVVHVIHTNHNLLKEAFNEHIGIVFSHSLFGECIQICRQSEPCIIDDQIMCLCKSNETPRAKQELKE